MEKRNNGYAMREAFSQLDGTSYSLVVLCLAFACGMTIALLLRWPLGHVSVRDDGVLGKAAGHLRGPLFLLLPALFVLSVIPLAQPTPTLRELLMPFVRVAVVIAISWLFVRLIQVVEEAVLERFPLAPTNNHSARRMHTQVSLLRKVVVLILWVIAFGLVLMSFERVRQLGTTLLASAGVLGIILGFAAQKSIATVIAGIQMAITQPIRIDDVLIVEGEWGRVEEITLTFVVIRIWDKRRLVVPVTFFLEKPFQNWTRTTAEIIGSVHLFVDHALPLEPLRKKLERLLAADEKWDGELGLLQVVGTTERAIELRALVSARDASDAWDLRCNVREGLIDFIQRRYPECLPRLRIETEPLEREVATGSNS